MGRQADRARRNEEIRAHNAKWAHEKLLSVEASNWFYQIMYVVYSQTPKGGVNFGLDFRDSALWPMFSQQNLDVLVPAAYDFIISCEGPWSKENEYHPPYVQAFYLLMAYSKERLSKLPSAAWRKFAPELFQCLDIGTFDLVALTLRFFAEHQPDVFFEELSKRFRLQLNQGKLVELYKFKTVLHGDIFRNLLASLDAESLTDIQRRGLYDEFWQLDAQQTAEYINTSRYANMPLDKWGVQTSALVLASAPEQRFSELLNLLRQNKEWGRAWIIQILGHEDYRHCTIAGMLGRLAVAQLKDFYAWLLINFPAEQAPHRTGCYEPDIMDHVYEGISRVFNELVSRVDPALPHALDSLAEQFPNLRYLCEWALRSRRALLDYECPTYNIQDIKKLLNSNNGEVVVNTANDLLDVVCGVLRKYQVWLTGKESPRVSDLWNELKSDKSVVSHKDEASFSNHIKSFLDHELPNVVINREVQLNLGTNGRSGARTDIWVTAISKTDNMRLRLCIEVKGSWNKTCRTAFRDQLCGKYMGDGGADAGVFLVGWFHSPRCKKNDNVWKSMDAMQECLKSQGDALRKEGFNVCPMVIDCPY